jgi:FtsP/CotA-like multicopper oxidase with cupredoxin domain
MDLSRRTFLRRSAAAATVPLLVSRSAGAAANAVSGARLPLAPAGYRPVVTPNGTTLPFRIVDGVKVFHLIPEPTDHEFAPGLSASCYGYNGRTHGPTIEAVEGDRVRIYVENRLPVATTVHWHGVETPSGMDGVGGLSQRPIEPGETFRYEFVFPRPGTFMYHSHHDEMTQMALGLMGMIVVHPKTSEAAPPDRDYVYLLSEWHVKVGARRPDPNEMTDFNVLTLNAKVFPGASPIVARLGERVRIRFGNLSAMDHHPMHLHGLRFHVTATDGGEVPATARFPETTVLVPVGTTRTIEFVADNPGDWALHCHMTHHVMTQMGHGIPNLTGLHVTDFDEAVARAVPAFRDAVQDRLGEDDEVAAAGEIPANSLPMMGGVGPQGYITMGGMFTVLKIRETLAGDADPGWYEPPPGTLAGPATEEELRRDGLR